jgi:tetratricopeptide (TPR) repeat protein
MGFLGDLFGTNKKKAAEECSCESVNGTKAAEECYNESKAFEKQEKWDLALGCLEKAIMLNPKHSKARMSLVYVYSRLFKMELAKKHFKVLKKLDPDLAKKFENSPASYAFRNPEQWRVTIEAMRAAEKAVGIVPKSS